MIILWHNILVHQQGALNSLLTTIPNRNYRANRSGLILQKKIRKFAENKQTYKQTNTQTENSITEATLIPCGSSGGAGQLVNVELSNTIWSRVVCSTSGHSVPLSAVFDMDFLYINNEKGCVHNICLTLNAKF